MTKLLLNGIIQQIPSLQGSQIHKQIPLVPNYVRFFYTFISFMYVSTSILHKFTDGHLA